MKLTTEERTLIVDALRKYAANLSGFLGKMQTARAVARLEKRVKRLRDLADRFEQEKEEVI